jgi:hypothetical protein
VLQRGRCDLGLKEAIRLAFDAALRSRYCVTSNAPPIQIRATAMSSEEIPPSRNYRDLLGWLTSVTMELIKAADVF